MINKIFSELSIEEIQKKYKSKELSPVEIAKKTIENVEKLESTYMAWVAFDEEKLLKQAKEAEENLKKGTCGLLEGIPFGVKDIFNTVDFPTQMGSPLWKDFTPGNDARAVFNIKRAGGMIAGKTVTAEFAVHTLDKTLNPHDVSKTPGTSSSGSAVAVALGMVPAALGTQTAGSIVRPASFCGVYGCKPSFGTIPRIGTLKTTDSLDTIGFLTGNCNNLRIIFDSLRVWGNDYPISNAALSDLGRQNKPGNRPWRVAFVRTYTWENASPYAKQAMENFVKNKLSTDNIEVEEPELPRIMENTHRIHPAIYNKSLSYYFKNEYDNPQFVSPIMKEMIADGMAETVETYKQALHDQSEIISQMDEFMKDFDVIVSLSTAGEAPPRDKVELPDSALMWTLSHLPVVSVPMFTSPNGLPFGMQIAARKYNDYLLFNFVDYLRSLDLIPEEPNPSLNL